MKKTNRILTVILCLAIALTLTVPALAASLAKEATLHYRDIKIVLDGEEIIPKDVNGNVVEPFIVDGTTYLPVRAVSGALGLTVDWVDKTSTVTLDSQKKDEKTIYITRTGSKYHYDPNCNGGTYWPVPYETAVGFGLKPCNKCVHD